MSIDPEAFRRDLEAVADEDGVPFGRLKRYRHSECRHIQEMQSQNLGTLLLFRAFQSLFLETPELINTMWTSECAQAQLTFYTRFVPKLLNAFHHLSASELAARHGYPLPAYTILRNAFDHLVLISAAMQGITDFYKIEGSAQGNNLPARDARKLRVDIERYVRRMMTGAESGLTENSIEKLQLWDDLFDLEVHGANLSFSTAIGWIQGNEPLHIHPEYQPVAVSLYANRLCEVAWMAHRLLPLLQHSALEFPQKWADNWRIVDGHFEDRLRSFAEQQVEKVSLAVIDLVKAKFPFSASSRYPLEGQGMPEST